MILIDSNAICYREAYAIGDKLSYEERKVGIIFGFLREILKLSKLYNTNEFAFCWDSRKSLRKQVYPEYKQKRKTSEIDPQVFEQFETIRTRMLPEIGFKNIFGYEGYESDDILAEIILSNAEMNFVIASSDEDLFQLLYDGISIYNLHSKKEYDSRDFLNDYGIECDSWSLVKSIAGCSSDNIKGIEGVGEKTAIKYILGQLDHKTKAYKKIVSEEGQKIIARNYDLINLPYKDTPQSVIVEDYLSLLGFMSVCKRFGFSSIMKDIDIYKERLKLQ